MAQWINTFQNNSFVNPTRLPLLCENTGAIALAQLGLMAGRQNAATIKDFLKLYTR